MLAGYAAGVKGGQAGVWATSRCPVEWSSRSRFGISRQVLLL